MMSNLFGCTWTLGVEDSHGAAQGAARGDRISVLPSITL